MLQSMIEQASPTRAEVSDVANAIFDGTDAIMLSGETTVGKYPVNCVQVFDRIARRIERSGGANYQEHAELTSARQKLVKSAVIMANDLKAEAIIVFTIRGSMARHTAWMRPRYSPIFAICDRQTVADSLALNYGVVPIVIPFNYDVPEQNIGLAFKTLIKRGVLHPGNTVVVITSVEAGEGFADAVQMRTV
jgi:pyruvate kinase